MGALKVEDFEIINAVKENFSFSGVLRTLGYSESGSLIKMIKAHIARLELDTSHFNRGKAASAKTALAIQQILSKRPGRLHLSQKRRLFNSGILKEECSSCGLGPTWNGKPITLQIDHINGDSFDHRLENLRILCPNCHSQTSNWGGRNVQRKPSKLCVDCSATITERSERCKPCSSKLTAMRQPTKINWSKVDLQTLIWQKPMTTLSKELGVSDVAIRKRCKKLGIQTPPRGYFLIKSGSTQN
jgi:hypothetical protein